MRRVIGISIGLVMGVILLGSGASLSKAIEENVVKNPSFENGTSGWGKRGRGDVECNLSEDSHSGQNAAYIKIENAVTGSVGWVQHFNSASHKLALNTTYTASVWIKTKNLQPGGKVLYMGIYVGTLELAKQRKLKSYSKHGPSIKGTTDWTYYKLTFTTPKEPMYDCYIYPIYLGSPKQGEVWIDEVKIIKVDANTLAEQKKEKQRLALKQALKQKENIEKQLRRALLDGTEKRMGSKVRLMVQNPSGLTDKDCPITTGVPFPIDALESSDKVALFDDRGKPVPIQARVSSTWGPKGTVRWLLLDFQADIDGAKTSSYELRFGADIKPEVPARGISISSTNGETWLVDTGPLVFEVRKKGFDFIHQAWRVENGEELPIFSAGHDCGPYVIDGSGQIFRAAYGEADELTVEENGPLRCVICAKGWFYSETGEKYCKYIVRIHAFRGKPFIKVLYTFIITEGTGKAKFRDIGLSIPIKAKHAFFGGDTKEGYIAGPGKSVYLLQYDSDKFFVKRGSDKTQWEANPPGERAPGWVSTSNVTIACRDFWQQFPKEIEIVGDKKLIFHVWPAHGVAKPDRKVTNAMLQYLWFCHEGKELDFSVPKSYSVLKGTAGKIAHQAQKANVIGLAKTHELMIWFHSGKRKHAEKMLEAWQNGPVVCMANSEWMCESGVFGHLHPYDPKRFPDAEKNLSKAWDCERRLEAYTKDYGMFNFGDGHSGWNMSTGRWIDTCRCWRGFHHGAPRVSWLLYLRSGNPKYLRHAIRNARHVMDIDICHHATPKLERLKYPEQKIKGALNDYKGLVHWHSGGRLGYNSLTDFMLYYYYLTGDRRGLDVAQEWGTAIKKRYQAPYGGHGGRAGAGVTAALIEIYKATWEPEYKCIIDVFVKYLLDKCQNMDGTKKYGGSVAHIIYCPWMKNEKPPVGAFTYWENYAPWIERYYDLTGDKLTGERIVAWANAYLAGFGDMCSRWGYNEYVNILAYAYSISRDEKYLAHGFYVMNKYLDSIENAPGNLYDGFPHLGQMSHGPGYMAQRIPYLLAALALHNRPVVPVSFRFPKETFRLPYRYVSEGGKKVKKVMTALFREEQDGRFQVIAQGTMLHPKGTIIVSLRTPDGKEITKEYKVVRENFEIKLDVPTDEETGVYKLSFTTKENLRNWFLWSTLRTEPRLGMVFPISNGVYVRWNMAGARSRYYFMVPKGTRAFSLSSSADMVLYSFVIYDPTGSPSKRVMVAPQKGSMWRNTVRILVMPEQAGKLWSIDGLNAWSMSLEFKGEGAEIPPCFAVEPELFFVPPCK